MTIARQRLGRLAEDYAAAELERSGAVIVARNARPRAMRGDVDLVAVEGPALVFVEVKALRAGGLVGPERPALAVGPRKRARVRRLARAWLAEAEDLPRFAELRFDVVEVFVDALGQPVRHERIRNAF